MATISAYRQFLPFFSKLGSRQFLGLLVDLIPIPAIRNIKRVSMVLHKTSVEVFTKKRKALESGEVAMSLQVGEGRDIMSVLCKPYSTMKSLSNAKNAL